MTTTIRRGSVGAIVLTWQSTINSTFRDEQPPMVWTNVRGQRRTWPGGAFTPLRLDGHFGEATELATEAWQAHRRLEIDGVVGPRTWGRALGGTIVAREPLIYGTDVSAMQGVIGPKEWSTMREQGIRFAIARACVGNETWLDAQAGRNIVRSRDHGIAGGLYFFAYPLRHIDPRAQVDAWLRRCELAGISIDGLALAFDIEWPPREERAKDGTIVFPWKKWLVTADSICDWSMSALERARELTGRDWLRYSYPYFLQCIESGKCPELANGPLWLADYTFAGRWPSPDEVARRRVPAPWSEITIMQHDGNGGLRLPNGVDADFNVLQGGERALARILAGGQPRTFHDLSADVGAGPAPEIMPDGAIAAYRRERLTDAAA